AASPGRGGGRMLDGFGVLGGRGAAVARPARDGRRRGPRPFVTAVHARAHLDLGRYRRAGRRAARRGRAGPPGRADQELSPVGWIACGYWPPCPAGSIRLSPRRARPTPGTT